MTIKDICEFKLPPLKDDCYLFLWRVACMAEEAYQVCKSWGFTFKGELIWLKKTVKGKRWFGMGYHLRAEHEACIVAVRGKPKVRNIRSCFEAKHTGKHSGKPNEFYELAENLCVGPYSELFARKQREGWNCYGNELT